MLGGELRMTLPSEDEATGGNVDLVRGGGRDRDPARACEAVVSGPGACPGAAVVAEGARTIRQLHHLLAVAHEHPHVAGVHPERRRRVLVKCQGLGSEAEGADRVAVDAAAQRGGDGLASEAPGRNARTGLVLTRRGHQLLQPPDQTGNPWVLVMHGVVAARENKAVQLPRLCQRRQLVCVRPKYAPNFFFGFAHGGDPDALWVAGPLLRSPRRFSDGRRTGGAQSAPLPPRNQSLHTTPSFRCAEQYRAALERVAGPTISPYASLPESGLSSSPNYCALCSSSEEVVL